MLQFLEAVVVIFLSPLSFANRSPLPEFYTVFTQFRFIMIIKGPLDERGCAMHAGKILCAQRSLVKTSGAKQPGSLLLFFKIVGVGRERGRGGVEHVGRDFRHAPAVKAWDLPGIN